MAIHGYGCALLGAELQVAQCPGDSSMCNDPCHLHPRGERRQKCAMPDRSNDMQPMGVDTPFSALRCRLHDPGDTYLSAVHADAESDESIAHK